MSKFAHISVVRPLWVALSVDADKQVIDYICNARPLKKCLSASNHLDLAMALLKCIHQEFWNDGTYILGHKNITIVQHCLH